MDTQTIVRQFFFQLITTLFVSINVVTVKDMKKKEEEKNALAIQTLAT